ncbi:MAG: 2-dehydro-3-deoxy-phosphogluconate aldolase [Phyllobacteriaceae bacterium]|nr:2-dehydro-3-deoxy-phosphogluconate aldolase [Phyllobacteriaceae bacterium]
MAQKTERLLPILTGQPVIPVLKIDRLDDVEPLARALVAGGLPAIEITLRTPVALEAIRLASRVEGAIVGAGTILNAADFGAAQAAGAAFIVSPGATGAVFDAADASDIPLLPGAITPSELMSALARGYSVLKFFPAEQAGGVAYLKSLASPFAAVRFCPTGGIGAANAPDYLKLPNVICVGGSWIAPDAAIMAGDWAEITRLSREAAAIARH